MRILSTKSMVLAPVAALLLAACGGSGEGGMDAVDTALEAEAIMELDLEWAQRYADRDMDWIAAVHAQNAVLLAPGGDRLDGRAAIRAFWQDILPEAFPETTWEPVMAKVSADGEMAYVYGTASGVTPDGTTVPMKYLEVWVKVDGEWKVAADMFNANVE